MRHVRVMLSVLLLAAHASLAVALVTSAHPPSGSQGLRFARAYGSHMVLQSAPRRANVWGWASTPSPLTLTLSGPSGKTEHPATMEAYNASESMYTWHVQLPATPAGVAAYSLSVAPSAASRGGLADVRASITDVLFGDVWVCR